MLIENSFSRVALSLRRLGLLRCMAHKTSPAIRTNGGKDHSQHDRTLLASTARRFPALTGRNDPSSALLYRIKSLGRDVGQVPGRQSGQRLTFWYLVKAAIGPPSPVASGSVAEPDNRTEDCLIYVSG